MTATIGPCISADSHVTEPPGTYIDRIDPKYRDRAPRMHYHDQLGDVMLIDNGKSLVPFWLVAAAGRPTEEVRLDSGKRWEQLWRGGWDPVARLQDQDTDGVVAEVILVPARELVVVEVRVGHVDGVEVELVRGLEEVLEVRIRRAREVHDLGTG